MKRFISFFLVVVFLFSFALSASASTVGTLSKLNVDEDDFANYVHKINEESDDGDYVFVFYDSILSMTLSLGAGDIDEMGLPEIVAQYVLSSRPDFKILKTINLKYKQYLAFGFMEKNEELCKKFNDALKDIKADGTLDKLKEHYLKTDGETESIAFEKFAGADTIRVAITGDLPPIDYVASDGRAAGFNTALLSEIAKKLKVNVRLVYTNTGARAASLFAGRSDVVFWYQLSEDSQKQNDIPKGVIVSEPYYDWDKYVRIVRKNEKAFNDD
ncbi:MAG: transporter substrate-binding domain-containing protein [Synergistaceae bacterium]|nr:transporter substrate-binding domain-containing protein [Synergistaceae bacterium]